MSGEMGAGDGALRLALREPQESPFESLRRAPSRASGQALRRAQESLRANGKRTRRGERGVRVTGPFDKPFESLRTGPG